MWKLVWQDIEKTSAKVEKELLVTNLQYKLLIPDGIECPGFVTGVEPGQWICGQIECAKWVTAARHVLSNQIAGLGDLKIGFQIRLLNKHIKLVTVQSRFHDIVCQQQIQRKTET